MADKNQNRIEVDLKLFQTKEIEALADFGRNIQNSIQLLQQITASFSGQVAQFADMGAGAGAGGQGGTARQSGGISNPLQSGYSSPASYSDQIANQRAGALGRVQASLRGATWAPANLNEYEKGVLHFGRPGEMTSTDLIRYGSYMSGMLGYQPQLGPNGELINRNIPGISAAARGVSTTTGAFARMSAMGVFQMPQNAATGFYGLSGAGTAGNLGLQLGYGRGGIGGSGIFGHGFGIGMKQRFQRIGTQWGSLGMISGEEAAQIQNELNQYGYNTSEGRGRKLYGMATNIRFQTGLDTGFISKTLDATMRYKPQDLKKANDALLEMGASARQARMGLEAFTEGVVQGGEQIAQMRGLSTYESQKIAMQYGAATGANPATVGAAMSVGGYGYWRNVEKHGGDYYKAAKDIGGRVEANMEYLGGIFPKQRLLDKSQRQQVKSEMARAYDFDQGWKEAFGNLSPDQVLNMVDRTGGDIGKAFTALDELQKAAQSGGGAGKKMSSARLRNIINLTESDKGRKKDLMKLVSSGKTTKASKVRELASEMGLTEKTIKIELIKDAKRLFRFVDEASKGDHGAVAEIAVESAKKAWLGPLGQAYGMGHALFDND